MKRVIKVNDKINNKTIIGEQTIRAIDHFEGQLKYKSNTFRNKKKYTRKSKYKQNWSDGNY